MGIADSLDEVLELGTKEFYAPSYSSRRRRRKDLLPAKAVVKHDIPEYRIELASLRNRASISQQELASTMKTTQSVISRFEAGWGNPTIGFVSRYCRGINVDFDLNFKEKIEHST